MRARREFYQPYVPDFFVCVFVLYWLARRRPIQNILLLVAGYVFYGWFHPWYAVMLGLSTIGDFFSGERYEARALPPEIISVAAAEPVS